MLKTAEEIEAGWAMLERPKAVPTQPTDYRLYEPLSNAADQFERWAKSPEDRIHTGITKIDEQMRGIGAGEMAVVVGFAHGGKTLLLLHSLQYNRDKHIALFIPDEPRQLVLTKLTCMYHDIDARELESRVAQDDKTAIDLLRRTAEVDFPHLAVFDQPLSADLMERAYGEVSNVWGRTPELVVVDYLDLLEAGETIPDKATAVKAFGRRHDVPLMVLHQTSRSAGADGKKLTMSSGAYGGEQQATMVLGVRRKRFEIAHEMYELQEKLDRGYSERAENRLDHLRYERDKHENTVTISLLKNKRPAGQLVDDVDFQISLATGRLTDLSERQPIRSIMGNSYLDFD